MGGVIRYKSKLDPRLRERAILQVGWMEKSEYEFTHHVKIGKEFGVTDEDPHSGQVILLVELDDRSHDRRNDTDRDALTRHAGYTTVRLPAGERPTQTSVERHIEAALGPALPRADRSPWQATQT